MMSEKRTPVEAQSTFYDAFTRGDLEAMMTVWAADEDIVCVHPGGAPVIGARSVRQSWQQILGAEEKLNISASVLEQWIGDEIATFVVTEHLFLPSQNVHVETLATNVFRKVNSIWKMVLHHGSPKPIEARMAPASGSHGVH